MFKRKALGLERHRLRQMLKVQRVRRVFLAKRSVENGRETVVVGDGRSTDLVQHQLVQFQQCTYTISQPVGLHTLISYTTAKIIIGIINICYQCVASTVSRTSELVDVQMTALRVVIYCRL